MLWLRLGLQVDAWIIGTSLNQRLNIRAGNELETDAVVTRTSPGILLQAMQVAPNLRFKRTSAGLKNAYHFPNASANFQLRPQSTAGVLIQDQFSHDAFILSGRTHST